MDPKHDAKTPPETPRKAVPAPKRRFRLEKLEERIAPAGHYNPQSKWVGGGGGGGGSATSSGSSGSGTSGSY